MKTDPDEEFTAPLREAFVALKQDESRTAPAFRAILARAEAASQKRTALLSWTALRIGAAAVAVVAVLWMGIELSAPSAAPGTALAEALPAFLAPPQPGRDFSLFTSVPESTPASPTDFLLPDHLTIELF